MACSMKIFSSDKLLRAGTGVMAQPCPVETDPFGSNKALDGSDDEYETYWAVTDDDLTRIVGFRACTCCPKSSDPVPVQHHFRGFEATIYSPVSGYTTQVFGTMDGPEDNTICDAHDMENEELM